MTIELSEEVRELFKECGKKGGDARSRNLTKKQKSAGAKKASLARWAKYRERKGKKIRKED